MDQVGWSAKTDEVWVELTQPPLEHHGSVSMGIDSDEEDRDPFRLCRRKRSAGRCEVGHRRWAHIVAVGEAEEEGGDLVGCQSGEVDLGALGVFQYDVGWA